MDVARVDALAGQMISTPYSNSSPPQDEAVVPCFSKALITLAPAQPAMHLVPAIHQAL